MTVKDAKCPRCGAVLVFSPKTGRLHCEFCDYEEEIKDSLKEDELSQDVISQDVISQESPMDEEGFLKENEFTGNEESFSLDWGTETKTVICSSCGAETVYDANMIADVCPYCGSVEVMESGDAIRKILRPNGVVAFEIDKEKAEESFAKWIKGKIFCPGDVRNKKSENKGVYIPYWTFDCESSASYTGKYGVTRQVAAGKGKTATVTDWYMAKGNVRKSFDDVLVSGSERYNKSHLRGIEPFRTQEAHPYRPEYLSGFSAERYTVRINDAWNEAEGIMTDELTSLAASDIRANHRCDKIGNVSVRAEFDKKTYKYLLLPVWISSFRYNDRVYSFAVNGQTGRVYGEAPISPVRVLIFLLIMALLFFVLYWLIR